MFATGIDSLYLLNYGGSQWPQCSQNSDCNRPKCELWMNGTLHEPMRATVWVGYGRIPWKQPQFIVRFIIFWHLTFFDQKTIGGATAPPAPPVAPPLPGTTIFHKLDSQISFHLLVIESLVKRNGRYSQKTQVGPHADIMGKLCELLTLFYLNYI